MQNIPKSHQPLFQLAQSLFVPNLQKKQFWANLILESISVSLQDLTQPEKLEITKSTEDDPLLVQQFRLEFLVSCLSTRPSHSSRIENTLDEKEENQPINYGMNSLISFNDSILHLMISCPDTSTFESSSSQYS
ncbi:hypothetical protein O181_130615 [Austropuccinia psidii MF-1]|uniref:Uncharacterized protein n=1 Tax=Austropuccinia psidii MF-1 TaxID=1389203 RepID=A0A9Q3QB51_9BASI|nr:hypothetical protein [Austropuccinia psidii MF-1]